MDRADYTHWNSADVARLLALLESERRYYQEIVAGVPVGLLVVTADLRVASANAAVRRIFGLRSADPVRGSLELLLPRSVLDRVGEVLRSGKSQTGHRVKSRPEVGGRELRVGIRPMTGWDIENPKEALITIEDLTEISAGGTTAPFETAAAPAPAEEGLRVPERALLNQLDAAVWACQLPEMRFIFVSEGASRLLGHSTERWMQGNDFWIERISAADRERVLAQYEAAIQGEGHFTGEYHAATSDGRTIHVHESARAVDGGEHGRYLIGLTVEIPERAAAADASSVRRERLEALRNLSARLSHDLNNLLMIVVGYSEDALATVSPSSTAHSSLSAIRAAGERLSAIAGQLRTYATFAPAAAAAVELNALLNRVRSGLAGSLEGRRLNVSPASEPVWVKADAGELETAIRAAISRSLAALESGAEVNVSVDADAGGGFAAVEIRDNASALGTSERNSFFEQLLWGKEGAEEHAATLSRAWFGVESWGGRMTLDTAPGGGNVLTILLPITEAPAQAEEPPAAAAAPPVEEAKPEPERGPRKILVVEDEGGIRALVRKILERHGYAVLDASDPESALEVVRNNAIDLIITDIKMPAMDGQELAQQLRRLRPEMKVLFISGYTEDASMYTRDLGPGMAFLQKPFTLGALVGKVRDVLGAPEQA
ncbi:MAG TPA: response regulator [Bryobacteraceae bacterium]|nr:response regulator [Bryobacteraceae bacterium]